MSNRWPAGIVRKTPVTPAGPFQNGAASGVWSLADAAYWTKQGLWPIAGNFLAVEDVFSTWLYTGNGSTQTITNGIDLAGKGGLVWLKSRSAATNNFLFDTTRGVNVELNSDTTDANATLANSVTAFNSNGFAISSATGIGVNAATYASWTFREAPKFFDVVTYTGTGANRTIAHNLGVAPGCILVKRTNTTADWQVYHRSNANTEYMALNLTNAKATGTTRWNSTTPTATEFTVGTDATVNASGSTYVAYLFAHDATSDGIIQCGSYTYDSNGDATVNLGWEPQFLITKLATGNGTVTTSNWALFDTMRGFNVTNAQLLNPNLSNAETTSSVYSINSTGFSVNSASSLAGVTDIYIAIRRGPMKTPTLGTSVFAPVATTADSSTTAGYLVNAGFPVDLSIFQVRNAVAGSSVVDRLRGIPKAPSSTNTPTLYTPTTIAENLSADMFGGDNMTGIRNYGLGPSYNIVNWMFRRAPGFFDEVCYSGTGAAGTITHNLGVVPELMIVKSRNLAGGYWAVYANALGNSKTLYLNLADAPYTSSEWNNTSPTSTVYSVSGNGNVNGGGYTYVSYLFASCPGVSKVGSYTGTGALQTINCAFTTGARFVLIKRTDSTGDWYVWDSARGIVAGNDPYLLLNSTAAEVTSTNYVDTDTTGFKVTAAAPAGINAVGGTYIFLAIA